MCCRQQKESVGWERKKMFCLLPKYSVQLILIWLRYMYLSHININWTEYFGSKQNIFLRSQPTDSFCCLQHIFNHFSALSVCGPRFISATRLTNSDTSISPVFYKITRASAFLLAAFSCVDIWYLFGPEQIPYIHARKSSQEESRSACNLVKDG